MSMIALGGAWVTVIICHTLYPPTKFYTNIYGRKPKTISQCIRIHATREHSHISRWNAIPPGMKPIELMGDFSDRKQSNVDVWNIGGLRNVWRYKRGNQSRNSKKNDRQHNGQKKKEEKGQTTVY